MGRGSRTPLENHAIIGPPAKCHLISILAFRWWADGEPLRIFVWVPLPSVKYDDSSKEKLQQRKKTIAKKKDSSKENRLKQRKKLK